MVNPKDLAVYYLQACDILWMRHYSWIQKNRKTIIIILDPFERIRSKWTFRGSMPGECVIYLSGLVLNHTISLVWRKAQSVCTACVRVRRVPRDVWSSTRGEYDIRQYRSADKATHTRTHICTTYICMCFGTMFQNDQHCMNKTCVSQWILESLV